MTEKDEEKKKEKSPLEELRDDMLEEMRRNDAMVRAIGKATFKKREEEKKKTKE